MQDFLTQDGIMVLARVLAVLVAIPVHEVSHAFVSDKLGDPTARLAGRLTLNPLKHIDPWGLLSMLVIGVGWAKPVPVDARYYRDRKLGMAVTALAGPLSNLLLALFTVLAQTVFINIWWLFAPAGLAAIPLWVTVIWLILEYFALVNVSLALFNLIPIPPLDGSRILGLVLPEKLYFGIMKYERYIMVALLAAVFILPRVTGFSPLGWLLGGATQAVLGALKWLVGFVDYFFAFFQGG